MRLLSFHLCPGYIFPHLRLRQHGVSDGLRLFYRQIIIDFFADQRISI